jgi:hypothetical protein
VVTYLQLAHNERHPRTGSPVAKVIHNFGRADLVDREALRRLVASISRFLEPEQAAAAAAADEVEVLEARRMDGSWVLGRLRERLEIGQAICRVAAGRAGRRAGVHRGLPGILRRRRLPGHGLPARRAGGDRRGGLHLGRAPAQPGRGHRVRGYHIHLLGDGGRRRAGRDRRRGRR